MSETDDEVSRECSDDDNRRAVTRDDDRLLRSTTCAETRGRR